MFMDVSICLQLYHEVKETHKAIEVLSSVLEAHPECVDEELINILAELCIMTKAYHQVYEVVSYTLSLLVHSPPPLSFFSQYLFPTHSIVFVEYYFT